MNIWVFVLSVFTIFMSFVIYYLYEWYVGYTLLNAPVSLKRPQIISIGDSYYPSNPTSSLNIWIYVNSKTSPPSQNVIYYMPNSSHIYNGLYFNDNSGLFFTPKCALTSMSNSNIYNSLKNSPTYLVLSSVPIQKWTNIFINITNMQEFDMFINGKLEQTYYSSSPNQIDNKINSIYLGSTTDDIYVANLQRWPQKTDAGTIRTKYLNGLGSLLPKYNIGYTYSQGGQIINQNTLL